MPDTLKFFNIVPKRQHYLYQVLEKQFRKHFTVVLELLSQLRSVLNSPENKINQNQQTNNNSSKAYF